MICGQRLKLSGWFWAPCVLALLTLAASLLALVGASVWGVVGSDVVEARQRFYFQPWTRVLLAGFCLASGAAGYGLRRWLGHHALVLPATGLFLLASLGPKLLWERLELEPDGFTHSGPRLTWYGPVARVTRLRYLDLAGLTLRRELRHDSRGRAHEIWRLTARHRSGDSWDLGWDPVVRSAWSRLAAAARRAGVAVHTPADVSRQLAGGGGPP